MYRSDLIKSVVNSESLEAIAQRSEVSIFTVARARDGGNVSIKSLTSIAEACNLDMRQLFTFDQTPVKTVTVKQVIALLERELA